MHALAVVMAVYSPFITIKKRMWHAWLDSNNCMPQDLCAGPTLAYRTASRRASQGIHCRLCAASLARMLESQWLAAPVLDTNSIASTSLGGPPLILAGRQRRQKWRSLRQTLRSVMRKMLLWHETASLCRRCRGTAEDGLKFNGNKCGDVEADHKLRWHVTPAKIGEFYCSRSFIGVFFTNLFWFARSNF